MSAAKLLGLLERPRQTGPGKWLARCPAHDDRSPSLSIRETDDGRTLVHCFAGCSVNDVVSAVGLNLADLFPPRDSITSTGPNVPRINANDVLPVVVTNAFLIVIAIRKLFDGHGLSSADLAAIQNADEVISDVWCKVKNG